MNGLKCMKVILKTTGKENSEEIIVIRLGKITLYEGQLKQTQNLQSREPTYDNSNPTKPYNNRR